MFNQFVCTCIVLCIAHIDWLVLLVCRIEYCLLLVLKWQYPSQPVPWSGHFVGEAMSLYSSCIPNRVLRYLVITNLVFYPFRNDRTYLGPSYLPSCFQSYTPHRYADDYYLFLSYRPLVWSIAISSRCNIIIILNRKRSLATRSATLDCPRPRSINVGISARHSVWNMLWKRVYPCCWCLFLYCICLLN